MADPHEPLTKAAVADHRQADLFTAPAAIAGHMRGPVYVAPYTALRRRRAGPATTGPALPPGRIITTTEAERLLPPSFAAAAEEMRQRLMPRHVIRLEAEDATMRPAGFIASPRRDLEYGKENPVPAGGDGLPDLVITINVADHAGKLRPAADVVHTLLHEFGHAFQFTRFHQAPAETQAAIRAQWTAETSRAADPFGRRDFADAATTRRWVSRGIDEVELEPTLDVNLRHQAPYYRRFEEWFAEKFAAWMTRQEADTPVARFFEAARLALLDAWRRALFLLGMPAPPGGAFERFLDESWTTGGRPMRKAIIFLKAVIPGGAMGDLFAQPVQVAGYARKDGVFVAPHQSTRRKAPERQGELIREHERLVRVLRSPSHADDAKEAERQAAELAEMKAKAKPPAETPASDMSESHREWRENYSRVTGAPDLSKVSTTDIRRAIGFASHAIVHAEGRPMREALAREMAHMERELASRRPPAAQPAALGRGADLGGNRPTYPDGRLIPQDGDEVFQNVAGPFGMAATLTGVVRGKRVHITGANSIIAGSSSRKTDSLTEHWAVKGDPELARRRAARDAKEAAAKAAAEAERAAEEARAQALAKTRGTLDPASVQIGDVVEDPDGVPHLIAEKHGTDLYGHPLGGDPSRSGLGGDLRGWRKTGATAPEGSIIVHYDPPDSLASSAMRVRKQIGGQWVPVEWSDDADDYVPIAPLPAASPEAPAAIRAPEGNREKLLLWAVTKGDRERATRMSAGDMLAAIANRRFDLAQRAMLTGDQPEANAIMNLAVEGANVEGALANHLDDTRGQAAFDFLAEAMGGTLAETFQEQKRAARPAKAAAAGGAQARGRRADRPRPPDLPAQRPSAPARPLPRRRLWRRRGAPPRGAQAHRGPAHRDRRAVARRLRAIRPRPRRLLRLPPHLVRSR